MRHAARTLLIEPTLRRPSALTSRNNLATALAEAGDPAHAIPLAKQTLSDLSLPKTSFSLVKRRAGTRR